MINRIAECEAIKHALKEYPKESVGFVVLGKYQPVENHAKEPNDEFAVEIGKDYPQGLTALMHSHPKGNPNPRPSICAHKRQWMYHGVLCQSSRTERQRGR